MISKLTAGSERQNAMALRDIMNTLRHLSEGSLGLGPRTRREDEPSIVARIFALYSTKADRVLFVSSLPLQTEFPH